MTKRTKKNINGKKRVLLFSLVVLLAGIPIASEMRMHHEQQKKWEGSLGPFEGRFRVESVSGSLKRKIGEIVVIERKDGELIFRPEQDNFDFKFAHLDSDDFEIRPTKIKMTYLRDSTGKIVGLVSKPDPRNFKFTLKKLE